MKKNIKILSFILCLMLSLQVSLPNYKIVAETQEETVVKYKAVTTSTLRVRNEPVEEAHGFESVLAGNTVMIIDVLEDWCYIHTSYGDGYIPSKYLSDFSYANKETTTQNYTMEERLQEEFVDRFVAMLNRNVAVYNQPTEKSSYVGSISNNERIIVSSVADGWALVKYNEIIGYVQSEYLVQYDTIDPYEFPVPGMICYDYAAVLQKDTPLYDMENMKTIHRTIPAGAVLCVEEANQDGFMHVQYMSSRQGMIDENDVYKLIKVVPYDEAEKGDLISVFTTFFPVHNSNSLIIGRVYNIYFGSELLNGKVLQVGEEISVNETIGPYRYATGYKKAPIASQKKDYGFGGGTCQVNTTLYNTLLQIPVQILHRQVHSRAGAVYAPVGFDAATGSSTNIDMRFKNTLPYPMKIVSYISDNVLTLCVYRAE